MAEETVWLTQKLISVLFEKGRRTITEHLRNLFESRELKEQAVCRDFRHTAEDGKDYTTRFYNLDAIVAVGLRVNSARATQFRQWAAGVLRDFALRGYVLDKERLKNSAFLSQEYCNRLVQKSRVAVNFFEHRSHGKSVPCGRDARDWALRASRSIHVGDNVSHFGWRGALGAQ